MHGVLLASGGFPLLPRRPPPPFLEIDGRSIFEWQLESLGDTCDTVTAVFGQGFVDSVRDTRDWGGSGAPYRGPLSVRQGTMRRDLPQVHEEKLRDFVGAGHAVDLSVVVMTDFDDIGSAEIFRRCVADVTDEVLVLDGLTIVRPSVIRSFVSEWETRLHAEEWSVAAVRPGTRERGPAVSWNVEKKITGFGDVSGHDAVGLYGLHERHVLRAHRVLQTCQTQGLPVLLPSIDTTYLPVPPDAYSIIESAEDFRSATSMVHRWTYDRHGRQSPSSV